MTTRGSPVDIVGFDPLTETYHARCNADELVAPSTTLIETVAVVENCDPLDLPLLYDVVDPDAVDDLVVNPDRPVKITFDYAGHSVSLSSWGDIVVSDAL